MSTASRSIRRMKRHHVRQLRAAVGTVLREQWDLFGYNAAPAASNEYDSYVSGVIDLLARDASEAEVMRHLDGLVRVHIGLTDGNREHLTRVARALRAAYRDADGDAP